MSGESLCPGSRCVRGVCVRGVVVSGESLCPGSRCVRGVVVSGKSLCPGSRCVRGVVVSGESLCPGSRCVRGVVVSGEHVSGESLCPGSRCVRGVLVSGESFCPGSRSVRDPEDMFLIIFFYTDMKLGIAVIKAMDMYFFNPCDVAYVLGSNCIYMCMRKDVHICLRYTKSRLWRWSHYMLHTVHSKRTCCVVNRTGGSEWSMNRQRP